MGLICPKCSDTNMKITSQIQLPPDSRSDEVSVQILKCKKCNFEGLAVYEESRRGSLNDESIHHRGYKVSKTLLKEAKEKITHCPTPKNSKCKCSTYIQLKKKNNLGRTMFINDLNHFESFEILFRLV
jgi:hypothetical protein